MATYNRSLGSSFSRLLFHHMESRDLGNATATTLNPFQVPHISRFLKNWPTPLVDQSLQLSLHGRCLASVHIETHNDFSKLRTFEVGRCNSIFSRHESDSSQKTLANCYISQRSIWERLDPTFADYEKVMIQQRALHISTCKSIANFINHYQFLECRTSLSNRFLVFLRSLFHSRQERFGFFLQLCILLLNLFLFLQLVNSLQDRIILVRFCLELCSLRFSTIG
mmetsp:Transcript_22827/g.40525  ORF Transcript_22827/g.40525 Transcript_22827/m.40525 type:complete len:224 (-) Transcript_22827:458-1129(-)